MLIKPILAAILETALNRYLHLDPDAGVFLAPLSGKVVAVNVTPFAATLYLCPNPEGIQVLESYVGDADTTLSGSPAALGLMGFNPMRSLFAGQVHIAGDVQVGRKFQLVFEKLNIDLEEQLSKVTGDVVAHQVGRLLRGGKRWGQQTIDNLQMDVAEYLHEESRDLPSAPELEIAFRQVDTLRSDYDRLLARVERLERLAIKG